MISVSDIHSDEPIGETGVTPPFGNHIVLDIGDHRYAVLAHLKEGSAQVSKGERGSSVNESLRSETPATRCGHISTFTSRTAQTSTLKPGPCRSCSATSSWRGTDEPQLLHRRSSGAGTASTESNADLSKPSEPVAGHQTHRLAQRSRQDRLHALSSATPGSTVPLATQTATMLPRRPCPLAEVTDTAAETRPTPCHMAYLTGWPSAGGVVGLVPPGPGLHT